jgi:UPF0716 family protein affecting phage T7 exclusion
MRDQLREVTSRSRDANDAWLGIILILIASMVLAAPGFATAFMH